MRSFEEKALVLLFLGFLVTAIVAVILGLFRNNGNDMDYIQPSNEPNFVRVKEVRTLDDKLIVTDENDNVHILVIESTK